MMSVPSCVRPPERGSPKLFNSSHAGVACIGNTSDGAPATVDGVEPFGVLDDVEVVDFGVVVGGETRTACSAAMAGPETSPLAVSTATEVALAGIDVPPSSSAIAGAHTVATTTAHRTLHRV